MYCLEESNWYCWEMIQLNMKCDYECILVVLSLGCIMWPTNKGGIFIFIEIKQESLFYDWYSTNFLFEMWNFLIQIYEKLREFIIVTVKVNKGIKTFPGNVCIGIKLGIFFSPIGTFDVNTVFLFISTWCRWSFRYPFLMIDSRHWACYSNCYCTVPENSRLSLLDSQYEREAQGEWEKRQGLEITCQF